MRPTNGAITAASKPKPKTISSTRRLSQSQTGQNQVVQRKIRNPNPGLESLHWTGLHVLGQDSKSGTWNSKNVDKYHYTNILAPKYFTHTHYPGATNISYWCVPNVPAIPK